MLESSSNAPRGANHGKERRNKIPNNIRGKDNLQEGDRDENRFLARDECSACFTETGASWFGHHQSLVHVFIRF